MDKTIITSRLKLVLIESAEEESRDMQDLHIVRNSPEAMAWRLGCTFGAVIQFV